MTRTMLTSRLPRTRAGRSFAVIVLFDSVGTGLYLAGATIFFVKVVGLTAAQVGVGLAVAGAAGLCAAVPLGALADRIGARRLLIIVQLWRAVWFAVLAFTHGPLGFIAVSACLGVVERAVSPVSQAVVAVAVPEADRTQTMAAMRSVRNAGFSAGAAVAAPLLATHSLLAYRSIMIGDALSFVVASVLLVTLSVEHRPGPVKRGPLAFLSGFKDWRYLRLAGLNGVLTLHTTVLTVAMPLWAVQVAGTPTTAVPLLIVLNTLMAVVLQVPFAKGSETREGAERAMCLAGASLAGCFAAMALAWHAAAPVAVACMTAAVILLTLGELWQSAGGWELSHRYAAHDRKAEYLAIFSLGLGVQEVVGPPLAVAAMALGRSGWILLAVVVVAASLAVPRASTALSSRVAAQQLPESAASPPRAGAARTTISALDHNRGNRP